MAGVKLIREGRLEPKKVKATLRGKPAKATNIKLGPGWADVMPVEPGGVWGNSDAKPAVKQEAPHSNEGRSHIRRSHADAMSAAKVALAFEPRGYRQA